MESPVSVRVRQITTYSKSFVNDLHGYANTKVVLGYTETDSWRTFSYHRNLNGRISGEGAGEDIKGGCSSCVYQTTS